jgi:hypothetical protein
LWVRGPSSGTPWSTARIPISCWPPMRRSCRAGASPHEDRKRRHRKRRGAPDWHPPLGKEAVCDRPLAG